MIDAVKNEVVDLLSVAIGSLWRSTQLPDLFVEVCGVGSAPDLVRLYDTKYGRLDASAHFEVNIIDFRDIYEPVKRR